MRRLLIRLLLLLSGVYMVICIFLYFFQEKLIFFPDKLAKDFKFQFVEKFEEININTSDGKSINGLLFKADSSKGLIFYLHGNAGALNSWGDIAKTYLDLHYDVYILDYRGFGKSEGAIESQEQIFQDVQLAYDEMKRRYAETKIVVLGYSIGTGPAAHLASINKPKLLILQAPYYSLIDMMRHKYPILPTFLLKYRFETGEYLKNCKSKIIIFHGDADEVVYYGSSLKLQKLFKQSDSLITLRGQRHNGITDNRDYKKEIGQLLSRL